MVCFALVWFARRRGQSKENKKRKYIVYIYIYTKREEKKSARKEGTKIQRVVSHGVGQNYRVLTGLAASKNIQKKNTPWPECANELYRPSDRRLSAKLVPTFADRRCRVVSATDPHGRILGFLGLSRYFFFQVAPQVYS
jgi:hypothetical protein